MHTGFSSVEVDFGEADDADVVAFRVAALAGKFAEEDAAVLGSFGRISTGLSSSSSSIFLSISVLIYLVDELTRLQSTRLQLTS